ncbi:unnamed protein product [Ranitomeya imitator]|uniref:Pre-mRNA-processing factor 39 n=1 Tax=Ranitomeya imitator TaxID=111125 RepID=A0ABN9LP84_9NEOB|nr:unnamed protein product [Ranitomeya imitator]
MESQRSVIASMEPKEFLCSVDIRDVYLHILICVQHQRFLRFVIQEHHYQFTALPFGLASAPRVFTKCQPLSDTSIHPWLPVSPNEGSKKDFTRTTEIENMRHRIIEVHQEIFSLNDHEVRKRWAFEEGIKRPYFHVKPLEKVQINNWKEYLDFEIENGVHERVVILFERCVIACACYEEFWIKFAKYMEHHSAEGARHVYNRACNIHLLKKPLVHLLWAAFEEQQGNVHDAKQILKTLEESVEGLAMVRLRRVNLERRHGNIKEAEELLSEAMENSKAPHEQSFYAIKLARFYYKHMKNLVKAKKVLNDALQKDKENAKLYLNLIDLEFSDDVKQNESSILLLFDKVIKSSMALTTKITFSQRKVEFLEDFGSDIHR